jgi:hypothetical protein
MKKKVYTKLSWIERITRRQRKIYKKQLSGTIFKELITCNDIEAHNLSVFYKMQVHDMTYVEWHNSKEIMRDIKIITWSVRYFIYCIGRKLNMFCEKGVVWEGWEGCCVRRVRRVLCENDVVWEWCCTRLMLCWKKCC